MNDHKNSKQHQKRNIGWFKHRTKASYSLTVWVYCTYCGGWMSDG